MKPQNYHILNGDALKEPFPKRESIYGFGDLQVKRIFDKIKQSSL